MDENPQTVYRMNRLLKIAEIEAYSARTNVGSRAEYFALLTAFTETAPTIIKELIKALKARDAEQFQRRGFELRKILLAIGADDLLWEMTKTANLARRGLWQECAERAELFVSRVKGLNEQVAGTRANPEDAQNEDVEPQDHAGAGERKKILAVDDAPDILQTVNSILCDEYTVYCVTNHMAALKVLANNHPDLVILDIEMPDMSGFDMAEVIRRLKAYKNTPMFFLSANVTVENIVNSRKVGVNDFIKKPIEPPFLLSKVRQYLQMSGLLTEITT